MSSLRPLMRHQRQALFWMSGCKQAALFHEMRLGKTLVAIRWANSVPGRHLVVCPYGVMPTWIRELRKEGIEDVWNLREVSLEDATSHHHLWGVVNYDHLLRYKKGQGPLALPWTTIILDESLRIRNPQARITRVLRAQTEHIPRRVVLSGLPNPETPLDLVEPMLFVYGDVCGCSSYWKFRTHHCIEVGYNWELRLESRTALKRELRERSHTLRLRDVGRQSRVVNVLCPVTLDLGTMHIYHQVQREWCTNQAATQYRVVADGWLSKIAGGCFGHGDLGLPGHRVKVRRLLQLLQGPLADQAVVVWFHYNSELLTCATALERTGYGDQYQVVFGEVPLREREQACQAFSEGGTKILLIQYKCAKYGLDLSAADAVVRYSYSYSEDEQAQSMMRVEHPMKKKTIRVYNIVARDTIDEQAVRAVLAKDVDARGFLAQVRRKKKLGGDHA